MAPFAVGLGLFGNTIKPQGWEPFQFPTKNRTLSAKAVEIARQLCAGLAAAHDKGVLHRDLKPANIMLDGHGRARITDFGLAVLGSEAVGEVSGTPAYMAPEQLTGQPATVRSDIYSLGLVLYELLSGRRAFEASSLAEWRRVHSEEAPTHPSDHTRDLDPLVERVILRCLEKDPERRPRSAAQVAQALPGADPLAAAVAAGETPSPAMVAAAGGEGALAPRMAWALLATVVVLLGAICAVAPYSTDLGLAPMTRSPDALRDRSVQLVQRFGYTEAPADSASWIERDYFLVRWLADHLPSTEWRKRLRTIVSPVIVRYRQSPQRMVPRGTDARVDGESPAPDVPGMVQVGVDARGRLVDFGAVPPRIQHDGDEAPALDWDELFREAELDPARFEPVTPEWVPAVPFDRRAEWAGSRAEIAELPLRVSAATFAGKLVSFTILNPRALENPGGPVARTVTQKIGDWTLGIVILSSIATAVVFARRNLRFGRGDRRGATRLATIVGIAAMIEWALSAHLVGHLTVFAFEQLFPAVAASGFLAAMIWLLYVAVEPYVRRRMPELLIGWARALEGRISDPRVGRDVLIGVAFGAASALCYHLVNGIPSWFPLGVQTTIPSFRGPRGGALEPLAGLASIAVDALVRGPQLLVILFALRLLLRRTWLTFLGIWTFATLISLGGENPAIEVPGAILQGALIAVAAVRFGVLSVAAFTLTLLLLITYPVTLDFSLWYARYSVLALGLLIALTAWSFRMSLGERPVFGTASLDA